MNKEEYPKLQAQILQFLFDAARAVKFIEIIELIKKPENEAKYHCEVLAAQGVIAAESIYVGRTEYKGYSINTAGRKRIMEQ